jgi:HD-GYP domain-containing protein (c-di-GMP phosphodiesterase class II)
MMNRVRKEDLQVGQPLPWPVYDSRGLLLLRRGYIISSPLQLERLVQQGLYVDRTPPERRVEPPPDPAANSPFKLFDDFQTRLRRICDELRGGNNSAGLPERILRLGRDIQALCAKDADAVLGAVHLLEDGHYTVVQALHAAILVEVFLHTLSISREDRLPILAATLTKDIGMMDIHETLHRQQTPPSDEQWKIIRNHPEYSAQTLQGVGVDDGVWLDAVLHHHERLDGSGYPHALKDEDIFFPVRVLAIVDIYCAMIKRRAHRTSFSPKEVLREIFLQRAGAVDEHLAKLFIKELGIFPPGVFVKLRNSEVAVVTHRRKDSKWPVVCSIIGPRGAPLLKPVRRDPSHEEYEIRELIPRDRSVQILPCVLWGYANA